MKPYILITSFLLIILSSCGNAPATPQTEKKNITFKNTVVSLTFDDGNADNYVVRPMLADNDLHATFYIVSGFTNSNGYMTDDQLRDLYNDGNEIGGHTLNHANLPDVRGADLEREICQDRTNLLAYGFTIISFAYPYGHYDDAAQQAVIDCGYSNARGVSGGPDSIPPKDAYTLKAMPYVVSDSRFPKLTRYVTEVENDGGGWVIFIFHHVCDGCDKFTIKSETFSKFAQWLNEQQSNGLVIKTVGEVIGEK